MIVNSKKKYKSNTILGVIRNLVLDFILCFVTAYMRKWPIHEASAQGTTQNALYIAWGSKQKIFYDKRFTKVSKHKPYSKLLQWKMIESTYKVNTHCSLLYTLKIWNYLNYISKKTLFFSLSYFLLRFY